ncbi:NAD-dependent epimerase/dehydratase family protein [Marinoscillum furvescens]|uniref:Nucleoside-diphosphate-sugar epimerase n=1 Tax=Marinoscillum furvescens DSM 4134 TaxID=1122208 RepID=A0A3D9L6X3_MARFU|nr:NAD(P)-dependent oxidoreductase [Marinoscillum furvescens]REE01631.1 nucleoside-diphosphate-sugar epimerase [Marinoscillum furvescens DSM 4134]
MKILITGGSGFIGTNFHEYLLDNYPNVSIVNVDTANPKQKFKNSIWEKCDILDYGSLQLVFSKHHPDCVIHLAAETSCEPHLKLEDYAVNIQGSENVFKAASKTSSTKSLIHTSTQFVNQTDFPLNNFFEYKPHTIYGESKVESEKNLISGNYNFKWLIIRPTNVWGKWHLRYPSEFWRVLYEGKYIHPNKKGVIRSYGYVMNICNQVMHFIEHIDRLDKEVFYVGDEPILLFDWVNEFSNKLCGRDVRTVNTSVVYGLALCGDVLSSLGIKFPITSSRFRSMTTSNPAPMGKTVNEVGEKMIDWKEGIEITSKWLKDEIY